MSGQRVRPLLRSTGLLVLLLTGLFVIDGAGMSAVAALAATATATAAVASAIVACAVVSARCAPVVPRTRIRTALRDRRRRTAFLPQRDPDARGRTRPRAPGRPVLTAP
ncbi:MULTISPECIES: DUF6412 domain-containing protein [unclassified Streptomyces]|uniref:DUF6412 domain-containing protein n=1 Tax=unclassified Streptomyces TaxID=2593676 RepID=UPI00364AB2DF